MEGCRPVSKAVVVVAGGDPQWRDRFSHQLRVRGLTVVAASNGQKAIDAVRAQLVDLVIVDLDMPGLSGIDACRVIKTITKDQFLPVILLTTSETLDARIESTRTSADDHIAKPFEDADLVARVDNMLRVKRAHDDVQFAKNEIRYQSLHDGLRTLPHHRYFHDCLENEFAEAERQLNPLACCIVSVDEFRTLVSDHGPDTAAELLQVISDRVQQTIPATDVAAQFRTAEFGLLLRNTKPAQALTLADRIVNEVGLNPYELRNTRIDVTVAIGVGLYPNGRIRTHGELLDAASIALARARVAGPNRVCVVQQQGYIFRPTIPGAA